MTNAPRPDLDVLVRGGRARRRRRNMARIGAIVAAAVLIGGGAYGVTRIDREDPGPVDQPTEPTESETIQPYRDTGDSLEPGTYRKVIGTDEAGAPIEADLTFDGAGWESGGEPTVTDGENYAGLAVYEPLALASGSGCLSDEPNRDLGKTPQALARQLAELPRSTVVRPPTTGEESGLEYIHLRLRIDNQCPADDGYRVVENAAGPHGVNYNDLPNVVIIDFWVMEWDGTLVVVDMFRYTDTPKELVSQVARARDSITFVTE